MVKVIWTESALQDIRDIAEYIARDSVRYAELTALELFESADILEQHPRVGAKVPEFNEESIRQMSGEITGLSISLLMNIALISLLFIIQPAY